MARHARDARLLLGLMLLGAAALLRCGSSGSSPPPSSDAGVDGGPPDGGSDATTLDAGPDAEEAATEDANDASTPPDGATDAGEDASDATPACTPTCAHHPCGTSDGCNGTCAPAQDAGAEQCEETAYFTVTYGDPLFGGQCASSSDRNSTSCSAGAKRYCQALGFGTGFPEQTITTAVGILCVATPAIDIGNVALSALTGFISTCTSSNLYSIDCEAASDDYCTSLGYVAGFGPNEVDLPNVSVSCLPGSVAVALTSVAIADFESPDSTCCTTDCDTGRNQGCDATAADYCQNLGYAGGFGPLQASTTDVTVTCVLSN